MARATTQSFTGIKEIEGDIILFQGGNACLIFEITATNFQLLSAQEQEGKIFAFASLLNSLSFPIQIIIRSKKLDVTSYLKLLDLEVSKNSGNKLGEQIKKYKNFVAELVKTNTILDKRFYIVLSYSGLENPKASDFKTAAASSLHTRAGSIQNQLSRLNLKSKILGDEQLVELFYDLYNEGKGGKDVIL